MAKFDHIIMNPPYSRNLHLKILNNALDYSDDIVNLSPVRWLQDPLAELKKSSDWNKFKNIRDRIESIRVIPSNISNKLFSINSGDLGIYHITPIFYNNCILYRRHMSNTSLKILKLSSIKSINDIATKEGYRGGYDGIFCVINSHYGDTNCWIKNDYKLFCTPRYTNVNKAIFFKSEEERRAMFDFLTCEDMIKYAKEVRINQRVPWQFVPATPIKF